MANSRFVKLNELDPVTYSGFDNATQTVAMGIGVIGVGENQDIKNKFISLLADAGDDVRPQNVSARAQELFKTHQNFQEAGRADQPLPKAFVQQYYSIISHLLPEGDKGREDIRNFFTEAGIDGVLPRDETVENFAEMYNIEKKGKGRA